MLIGIDASRSASARRTGTEYYSLALLQSLLCLPTSHHWRLYFNQIPESALWPTRDRVEVCHLPWPRLWTHFRLSLEMLTQAPELLFVPAHVLPLISPPKRVVTIHDLGYRYYPHAYHRRTWLYLDLSTRANARRATLIIADSESTRRDLMEIYGTPAEKIRVVYPGLELGKRGAQDTVQHAETRRRLGIQGEYLLFVGTLQPRKNLIFLLRAYAELIKLHPGKVPKLVLAGQRGWLSDGIIAAIESLGLMNHVHVTGYVTDKDVPALYSGARLFLFPSLYEGFGFPILEAMAYDVPVICSNSSSLPEVAGQAARLLDPTHTPSWVSSIQELLEDEGERERLIAAGREQVRNFRWEKTAQETLAVLEEAGRA